MGKKASKRILVIDDNKDALHLMSTLLNSLGCEPSVTSSGKEGADMAISELRKGTPYSLITIDIQLPDMDGTEVISEVRKAGYKGGIVVFTAYPTAAGKKEAKAGGIDGYFSKTVLNKDLLSAILLQFCR